MIIHSFWTEKVVLSIAVVFLTINTSWPQSSPNTLNKKISITGTNLFLEDALSQLSTQTHMQFIYSSSMIDLTKQVSLAIYKKPVQEALALLSEQFDFEFIIRDNYVILKKKTVVSSNTGQKSKESKDNTGENIQSFNLNEKDIPPSEGLDFTYGSSISPISSLHFKETILQSNSLVFDSILYRRNYPLSSVKHQLYNDWGWFTSFGLFANDYSTGVSIYSGIPLIYGILNSGRRYSGYYRLGYGAGSSLQLSQKFMLQVNYVYANEKQNASNTFIQGSANSIIVKDGLNITNKQHQFKPMIQYNLNGAFTITAGPSINLQKTYYSERPLISSGNSKISTSAIPSTGFPAKTRILQRNIVYIQNNTPSPNSAIGVKPKSWIGFELSISYRIKFLSRK